MKVYVMTDMEGVAGVIDSPNYCFPESRYYERGCELTTLEVNAAIEGALAAGATDIFVTDGHGHGAITPMLLHPKARLLKGRPRPYGAVLDASFDVAISIGQHAKSNAIGGHLAHSGSFAVEDLTINGVSVGETGSSFIRATYYGVPYVFLSGDLAATAEAEALAPGIETAVVKEGIDRGSATGLGMDENRGFNAAAIHLHPTKARQLIREGVQRGIERRDEIKRFWLEPPYTLVATSRPENGVPSRQARVTGNDIAQVLSAPREMGKHIEAQ